jgi:transcriptional regulatory protein RtcR
MSELFGHEKGAFTGAQSRRDGLLRAADRGVLFLDEIGELGLDEQTMLLRAIEEQTFLPLGADQPVTSRFQLLAGTNRDLHAAVRAGRFREDLLARIDLWSFALPPLRERLEDLEPNLEHELERVQRSTGRRVTINKEARERFLRFAVAPTSPWRSNFRDLGAAVTRLATLAIGGRITLELVAEEIARLERAWSALERPTGEDDDLDELLSGVELDRFDRVQLAEVVRTCRRTRSLSAAGRELFAASRKRKSSANDADRLRKYLARFGLRWDQISSRPD